MYLLFERRIRCRIRLINPVFVFRKDRINKSYHVFGARVDRISLSYPAFGATWDKIALRINYLFIPLEPDKTIPPL